MQPCNTGDQLYSDASPYSECSLDRAAFVVAAQLTARSLPIPENPGSNPVIGNF